MSGDSNGGWGIGPLKLGIYRTKKVDAAREDY